MTEYALVSEYWKKKTSKKYKYYSKYKNIFHAAMNKSFSRVIVLIIIVNNSFKNTKVQTLAKILCTPLFKNRRLPLFCDIVLHITVIFSPGDTQSFDLQHHV